MINRFGFSPIPIILLLCGLAATHPLGFWIINDFHVNISYNSPSRPYGDSDNDSPIELFNEALKFCSETHPHPDFIILLGDFVCHQLNNQTNGTNILFKTLSLTTEMIIHIFPNTTIYPVIGNYEQHPVKTILSDKYYKDLLTKGKWDRFLTSHNLKKAFSKGGFYRVDITNGIRLLVLNSVIYMSNFTGSSAHKDEQLQWISEELTAAYKQMKTVIVISHVPNGIANDFNGEIINFLDPIYDEKLVKIFTRKEMNPIQVHLWAHLHTDQFKFYKDLFALVSPSVSPFQNGSNPAVRYFTFNNDMLVDYEQYRLDLEQANNGKLNWTKTYRFVDSYKSQLQRNDLYSLVGRIQRDKRLSANYLSRIFSSVRQILNPKVFLCLVTSLRRDQLATCARVMNMTNPHWIL